MVKSKTEGLHQPCEGRGGEPRYVMQRKCRHCERITTHAILRDGPHRDNLEDVHIRRCLMRDPTMIYFCFYCATGVAEAETHYQQSEQALRAHRRNANRGDAR
jgi:hypothetical protein